MISVERPQNPAFIETLYHTEETCNISEHFFSSSSAHLQRDPASPSSRTIQMATPRTPVPLSQLAPRATPSPFPTPPPSGPGLRQFRSQGFVRVPGAQPGRTLFVPRRPYDEALDAALDFCHNLAMRRKGVPPSFVWIHGVDSFFVPHPPTLASLGFALEQCVFIETATPLRTLRSVCEEPFFDVILFDGEATPAALQLARRWLKPASRPLVAKADEYPLHEADKLILFLD